MPKPVIDVKLEEAVEAAVYQLGAPKDNTDAEQVYLQTANGKLVYVHLFQLRDDAQAKWYQVAVDTKSGNKYATNNIRKNRNGCKLLQPRYI